MLFAAEPDVRLVSITVDPAYDTPEVLTRYAQSFAAQPQRWLFLTGDKATIYRLVREGFRLGLMDPQESVQSSAVPEAGRVRHTLWQLLTPASALAHQGAHPHNELSGLSPIVHASSWWIARARFAISITAPTRTPYAVCQVMCGSYSGDIDGSCSPLPPCFRCTPYPCSMPS